MTLNVTIEVFVLLYLGTAAAAVPEILHLQPSFLWMGTCRAWRAGSTDDGEVMCAGALWKGLMVTERSSQLEPSPAPLLPSCINICPAGLFPSLCQLCQLCQALTANPAATSVPSAPAGRGSLQPGMLLNTTRTCLLPLCSPFPHPTPTVRGAGTAAVPTRAELLTAAECHLLLPSSSQNSFLPGVPCTGESKSCSEQAVLSVEKGETQQFLLGSRVCGAGRLQD